MDELRDGTSLNDVEYMNMCKQCIIDNDKRFRIKNKINNLYKSSIKEQKSYKTNCVLLCFGDSMKNIGEIEKIIRKFSILYEKIDVIHDDPASTLPQLFKYDSDIEFINKDKVNFNLYKDILYDDSYTGIDMSCIDEQICRKIQKINPLYF